MEGSGTHPPREKGNDPFLSDYETKRPYLVGKYIIVRSLDDEKESTFAAR